MLVLRNLLAVLLVLAVLLFFLVFPMRYDRILRRTNKYYAAGDIFRDDGEWYKVVHVRPTTSSFVVADGNTYSDVFCRRMRADEAAVYEVMES